MSSTDWSPLAGWEPDPARPRFLRNPRHPGYLRTDDGRWWDQAAVDAAAAEVENAVPPERETRIKREEATQRELLDDDEVRRIIRRRFG